MKKLFLSLAFMAAIAIQAQDAATAQSPVTSPVPQLKLTPAGVESIIVPVEGMTASDMYKKAMNWVQETYKNPDKVLKANIENEKIRIDGFASNAWSYKALGITSSYGMHYTIEIAFKDGKYKFDYTVGEFSADGAKVLYDYTAFWKKDGTLRKVYADSPRQIEAEMNALNLSLYSYITGTGAVAKKNEW